MHKLIHEAAACEHVAEVTVISTCNRLEIYAEVDRFHGSVEDVSRMLVDRAGEAVGAILPHLYVHYDDGAVAHLFHVAAGLDSMAVGEGQILGQTREALRLGQELGTVGPALNTLFQQALRVGKRSRAETDIDSAAPSLVTAALARSGAAGAHVEGKRVVVVGAGSMAGLATATVFRMGAASVTVVNRTAGNAQRLAGEYGARTAPLSDLTAELGRADVVITCTGATGALITPEMVAIARPDRAPLSIIDLALPHDVDPGVADLPGVTLINLAELAEELHESDAGREVESVRRIVAQEVTAFLSARRQASVTPTVVALRSMATAVVDSEMERLVGRLPDLDDAARAEVLHTVRRVADKLLHQPTVRVKELANETGAVSYAAALAELFALDPEAVDAVTRPEGLTTPPTTRCARAPEGTRMTLPIRVGTRRSVLATTQSGMVAELIRTLLGREAELVEVTTEGDRSQADGTPLATVGGTGVFVGALRDALLRGDVDVAVHSLKDLPTYPQAGIALAAIPTREDPRDAVVARDGLTLGELPAGSRVGTGSPRRVAQLHALGLGLEISGIRGNVDTRISKVRSGEFDAVVLARAGLARIGRLDEVTEVLDPLQMLPAPGQGALAVECRADDAELVAALAALDDDHARAAVSAERAVLATLEGGCSAPIGALAEVVEGEDGNEIWVRAVALSLDGALAVRKSATGAPTDAVGVGSRLASDMLADGAARLAEPPDKRQNA